MTDGGELLQAERRLGTTLKDKYLLERVLGVGGMAVVYAATHRNRRHFAIKMLHPELSVIEELRVRFQREGYVANTVEHPGTVAVLDDDVTDDGAAFLVMELLRGAGVDALATRRGGLLTAPEALGLVYQLLDVLAAAHAKGVVHRDIKPANLFLDLTGQLKVLDFGIARLRDATASHLATGTGTTLGTPAFMAPEQALGNVSEIDAQTDLWAVGATLFTLFSGCLVHEGDNAQQLLIQAATRPARSLDSVVPGAPRCLVEVVARALAFDKPSRFRTAAEMQAEVARAAREICGGVPTKEQLAPLAAPDGPAAVSVAPTEQSDAPPPPGSGMKQRQPSGSSLRKTANPVSLTTNGARPKRGVPVGVLGAVLVGTCGIAAGAWWHFRSVEPLPELPQGPPHAARDRSAESPSAVPERRDEPRPPASNHDVTVEPSNQPEASGAPSSQPEPEHERGERKHPHQHGSGNSTLHAAPTNGQPAATAQPTVAPQTNPLAMPIQ
jgi:serine/threonine-protein kinase